MRGAFYEANNAASKILSWFSDGPDATRVWQLLHTGQSHDTHIYSKILIHTKFIPLDFIKTWLSTVSRLLDL